MTDLLNLIKAKDNESHSPLLRDHLKEALLRLGQIYNYIKSNENSLTYEEIKNKEKRKQLFKILTKALFLHDFGKINYQFQKKIYEKDIRNKGINNDKENWKDLQKELNSTRKEIRHEILSIVWSIALLDNSEESKKIRTAVLLHHYNEFWSGQEIDLLEIIGNYETDLKLYMQLIIDNQKNLEIFLTGLLLYIKENVKSHDFLVEALSEIKPNFSIIENLFQCLERHDNDLSLFGELYEIKNDKPDYDFLVILGILRRCDYAGSGNVNIEETQDISTFLSSLWMEIKTELIDKHKVKTFWQETILSKKNNDSAILIAPTGSGKTEFALIWARKQGRKLIYTLPLRVALNDIYRRFTKNNKDNIGLLHSTAFIEYIKDEQFFKNDSVDTQVTAAKLFSEPLLLSTPDQVFLTCLNFYGSDKLIGVYPLSSIVIDEIQTYDPEMASIIVQTLKIIHKLGGKVLIITATFPTYFKKFLVESQITGLNYKVIDLKKEIQDNSILPDNIKNYQRKRHLINIREEALVKINEEKNVILNDQVIKIINSENKNVLIIVNTVKKAIAVHKKLPNSELLHSRLLEKEKRLRVESIKNKLGNKEKGIILVATQIVEASIDIDFDMLYTEISSIDSQIQRWGRIHRSRDEDYNEESSNVIIFSNADRSTNAIYDRDVTEKTIEELKKIDKKEILNYEKERELIEQVFNQQVNGKTLKEKYEQEIEKNIKNLQFFTVEKKSEAQRLFRKIAGQAAIFPAVMDLDTSGTEEGKLIKAIAKILKDENNYELPWTNLIRLLKNDGVTVSSDKKDIDTLKWNIKKILYDYSINIPQYALEKYLRTFSFNKFKGFLVAKIKKEDADMIKKLGVDPIWEKSVDDIYNEEFDDHLI